ncbi:nuclease PIN, partial [Mycobacterium sp. ITM-2017-0098]
MPLVAGDIFAGYTIVRLLGSGGMGQVYLAKHPRLPRHDALKLLSADVSTDTDFRQRFIREADLAATLWHPNIVGVHDRGEADGQLWISMDYVEGTNTAQLLIDHYPAGLPPNDVADIVTAVAAALDFAHKRGLLHRDVKPANIMVAKPDDDAEPRILLSDFGIARRQDDVSGLTATNMTIGTVAYCAPEQLMGLEIDGRADQYALAATAYHLLTGSPPFPETNPAVVISRHLNALPPDLADVSPQLAALDPVIATALAKDPSGRFRNCTDFARAFAETAQACGSASTAASTVTAAAAAPTMPATVGRPRTTPPVQAHELTEKHRRWHRIVPGVAATVTVLIAFGVVGYFSQRQPDTAPTQSGRSPAAVLDGKYRLDFNFAGQTINGSPNPPADPQINDDNTRWWAFRSTCVGADCVATGTALDTTDPLAADQGGRTAELHLVDHVWQEVPDKRRTQVLECYTENGSWIEGSHTEVSTRSLKPQPDGTLRGIQTITVVTSECGLEGRVDQIPFVATRNG